MKRFIIAIFLVAPLASVYSQSTESTEGIKFETVSWTEVLAKAKKENKYVTKR